MNTVPARRCTSMCSASSSRALSCDHDAKSECREAKRDDASSEPVSAKGQASADRGHRQRPRGLGELSRSKEPLTFGWTEGGDFSIADQGLKEELMLRALFLGVLLASAAA